MLNMTINSIAEAAVAFTLNINDNINARSMANLIVDTDNSITVGQEIIINDDSTKIFAGTIDSYTKTFLRGSGGTQSRRRYTLRCVDFNQIACRRKVAVTYENQTISFILNDIVTNFLNGENITVGTLTKGSTIITQAVFNYISATDCFDYLRDAAGGDLSWNIDFDKELTFFQRSDNSGIAFDDSTCLSMTLEETRKNYRNSQLVRAGDSTTETQVDEIPSPKPDGESRTFTLRFPVATKPVIKVDTGSGFITISPNDIGINGLDSNKKYYFQKNSRNITQDLAETVLSSTDAITVSYQGLKPIIVLAEDPAGQNERAAVEGGTGIYQMVNNQRTIDDKGAALEFAQGLLVRFGTIPRNVTIESETTRTAGQLIQVQSDNLEINEDFLITDVNISDIDGLGTLRYNINGASGEDMGSWIEFFRSLKAGEDVSIRENEVLVLLQTIQETNGWQGATNIKAFDILVPSNTLFPSDTLFPNGLVQEEFDIND